MHAQVPEGGDCESERVLGACSCVDGVKQPGGCVAADSASWAAWNGTHASNQTLPPGLSLTCKAQPAAAPPAAAAAEGEGGQGQALGPEAAGEGGGLPAGAGVLPAGSEAADAAAGDGRGSGSSAGASAGGRGC